MPTVLGYVTPVRAYVNAGEIFMQAASGRVADSLATHFEKLLICTRVVYGPPPAPTDSPLDTGLHTLWRQFRAPFGRTNSPIAMTPARARRSVSFLSATSARRRESNTF